MESGYVGSVPCQCIVAVFSRVPSIPVQTKPRSKKNRQDDSDEEEEVLPPELTGKIMREAHLQQEEMKKDDEDSKKSVYKDSLAGAIENLKGDVVDSDEEEAWSEPESDFNPDDWEEEIDAEDEAVLAAFMSKDGSKQKQKTLADIILEKIKEKESGGGTVRYVCMRECGGLQPLCTVSSCFRLMNTEVAGCERIALYHYVYIEFDVYVAYLIGDDCNISASCVGLKSRMSFWRLLN